MHVSIYAYITASGEYSAILFCKWFTDENLQIHLPIHKLNWLTFALIFWLNNRPKHKELVLNDINTPKCKQMKFVCRDAFTYKFHKHLLTWKRVIHEATHWSFGCSHYYVQPGIYGCVYVECACACIAACITCSSAAKTIPYGNSTHAYGIYRFT